MIFLKLFFVFMKIGFFGFGGGMAMIPMIYQGATQFGLISEGEFSDLVGISQVTPGPLAVNAATYVGYTAAGVPGALVATFGVALPSFVLITVVCFFLTRFKESEVIAGAFRGIRPVTVGLIAAAVIFMGQSAFSGFDLIPIAICAGSVLAIWKFKLSPIIIVIGAAVVGALTLS